MHFISSIGVANFSSKIGLQSVTYLPLFFNEREGLLCDDCLSQKNYNKKIVSLRLKFIY